MKAATLKNTQSKTLTFEDVQKAYAAIKDSTIRTPTVRAARLSVHLGIDLYLKLENLQYTKAFKGRGALNKMLTLDEKQRKAGVIACSRGNHAQGLAYHGQRLGIPVVIVMPDNTPFNKIQKTEDFGAKVILHGRDLIESTDEAYRLAEKEGYTFVHPFDDNLVAAGQGTLGLEMIQDRPDLDVVVVPVGGGGLIAGVATAIKGVKPDVEIIGAQAENYPMVKAKFDGYEGKVGESTLAEGIAVEKPSEDNINLIKTLVSRIELASENEIEEAIFDLLSDEKLVVEGSAGTALAVVKKNLADFKGKKVGIVICGGNIDSRLLSTLIMRGMIRDGRISRLRFEIDDTPGQLADISRILGEAKANVIEVIHQRMMQTVSLKRAELDVVIEARDAAHVESIVGALRARGFVVHVMSEV